MGKVHVCTIEGVMMKFPGKCRVYVLLHTHKKHKQHITFSGRRTHINCVCMYIHSVNFRACVVLMTSELKNEKTSHNSQVSNGYNCVCM